MVASVAKRVRIEQGSASGVRLRLAYSIPARPAGARRQPSALPAAVKRRAVAGFAQPIWR
jgi:hypothetical protein